MGSEHYHYKGNDYQESYQPEEEGYKMNWWQKKNNQQQQSVSPVGIVKDDMCLIDQFDQKVMFEETMNEQEERDWMMNKAYFGMPVPKQNVSS